MLRLEGCLVFGFFVALVVPASGVRAQAEDASGRREASLSRRNGRLLSGALKYSCFEKRRADDCNRLGVLLMGQAPPDGKVGAAVSRALTLGCELENAASCNNLGVVRLKRATGQEDLAAAATDFARACALGLAEACANAQHLREQTCSSC